MRELIKKIIASCKFTMRELIKITMRKIIASCNYYADL